MNMFMICEICDSFITHPSTYHQECNTCHRFRCDGCFFNSRCAIFSECSGCNTVYCNDCIDDCPCLAHCVSCVKLVRFQTMYLFCDYPRCKAGKCNNCMMHDDYDSYCRNHINGNE